jgi:hypothetical protein
MASFRRSRLYRRVGSLAAVGVVVLATLITGSLPAGAGSSRWVGTYASHEQIGSFVSTGTLTLNANGHGSDGATLEIVSWSARHSVVTVTIGNDAAEVIVWKGHRTRYGIANPEHPGSASVLLGGTTVLSGTFYAMRISLP